MVESSMNNLILFVGDVSEVTSRSAKNFDSSAFLIDHSNFEKILSDKFTKNRVAYTSIGDLPKNFVILYRVFNFADKIIYCPTNQWSDGKFIDHDDVTNSMQGYTEFLLSLIHQKKNNVNNLDLQSFSPDPYTVLSDFRKSECPQLWIAGCSVSHGTGIDDSERYGEILAKKIKRQVSFLTAPGSSIEWAADQILRSDIRANDIIVWGLTGADRLPFWFDNRIRHLTIGSSNKHPVLSDKTLNLLLIDPTNLYRLIVHIKQVINFCNKVGAKLFLFGILVTPTTFMYIRSIKEFRNYVSNGWIDLGWDNLHPGKQQHRLFSDFCLDYLSEQNFLQHEK